MKLGTAFMRDGGTCHFPAARNATLLLLLLIGTVAMTSAGVATIIDDAMAVGYQMDGNTLMTVLPETLR